MIYVCIHKQFIHFIFFPYRSRDRVLSVASQQDYLWRTAYDTDLFIINMGGEQQSKMHNDLMSA